jgi:CheY-like chemotaxis protein
MSEVLAGEGHEVIPCETGESLLAVAGSQEIDLILLDTWPSRGMDAWNAACRAQEAAGEQIPLVACTGSAQWEHRLVNLTKWRVPGVVSKPFNLEDLLRSVRHAPVHAPSQPVKSRLVHATGGRV